MSTIYIIIYIYILYIYIHIHILTYIVTLHSDDVTRNNYVIRVNAYLVTC